MFESVRKHQRIFLGVILLLIIPSFVVVGAWDLIAPGADGATVAKVGKVKIQYPQWERAHQQSLDQIRAQLGGRLDASMLDTPASRQSTLNDLVTQQILLTAANDLRIRISDDKMRRTIASIPAVQRDGKFDMALYERALKAQGLTPEGFEQQIRADLMVDVLPSAIATSTLVPRAVARRLAQVGLETRTVRLKKVALADVAAQVSASEADIEQFYQSNSAQFQTQEEVDIALIAFAKPASAETVEQFSNMVYEQSDSLEPASKKFGLPIQTVRRVQRGGSAERLPSELQRVVSHPKLQAALFSADALQNKRNTEAVEIAPGVLASARVIAHRPAATIPLASVKPQVERAVRERKAAEKATAVVEALVKEFSSSKALPTGIAAARNLGRSDRAKAGADVPDEVLSAVFSAELKTLPTAISVPASARLGGAWMAVIESAQVPANDASAVKEVLGRELQRLEQSTALDTLDRWVALKREAIGVKTFPDKLTTSQR